MPLERRELQGVKMEENEKTLAGRIGERTENEQGSI